MKPKNKSFQTLPDKRGKIKNCNPEKSFPCGKACLSLGSDILGRCQKNLNKSNQNKSIKIIFPFLFTSFFYHDNVPFIHFIPLM